MQNSLTFPSVETIETPRLVLREITHDDTEIYYSLCSDVEVMQTYGLEPHRDVEQTRAVISFLQVAHREQQMIRWAITLKETGQLVGDVGFWRFVKERFRGEVGAKLAKAYWSGGFMTEALSSVIQFGFDRMGLHTVEANVDPNNRGAIRLVEKVGFTQEGLLREHSYDAFSGEFLDTALFTIWNRRRSS